MSEHISLMHLSPCYDTSSCTYNGPEIVSISGIWYQINHKPLENLQNIIKLKAPTSYYYGLDTKELYFLDYDDINRHKLEMLIEKAFQK